MKTIIKIHYVLDEEDKKSIKKQMIDMNLTYRNLAKKINISTSYICDILNGSRNLLPDIKKKFEDVGIVLKGE